MVEEETVKRDEFRLKLDKYIEYCRTFEVEDGV